ncbi:acyl carrier protein [Candidatus Magnetomonas plexicatena]|uniref:acyl carrier protein n=1 Tax=Candidatus Magnetomonas plexicatena TaxID=2552947 RepID=UPI001C7618B8|nr:acyl carrier protein [Nitrospirales bacterium LBB_01]
MTPEEIKTKVRAFLLKYIKKPDIKDDEDYFASKLINSLFAMQLVMFVEKEFKIKVEDKDLEIKNFNSIDSVSGLITRKLTS